MEVDTKQPMRDFFKSDFSCDAERPPVVTLNISNQFPSVDHIWEKFTGSVSQVHCYIGYFFELFSTRQENNRVSTFLRDYGNA